MKAGAYICPGGLVIVVWLRVAELPVNSNESQPDRELLQRMAAGESAALGTFYDLHASRLFGLALRILNDPKEAEDTLQEVFLRLWENASAFDSSHGSPLAWAITMTRNRAIDRLRSAQRRVRLIDNAFAESGATEFASTSPRPEEIHTADETELVRNSLAQLPGDQRQAIEMAFFSGLTQSEIAAALNQPLGTIKARIRRGMLKLREDLGPILGSRGLPQATAAVGR